jgi:hypothetical protein
VALYKGQWVMERNSTVERIISKKHKTNFVIL